MGLNCFLGSRETAIKIMICITTAEFLKKKKGFYILLFPQKG